MTKLGHLFYKVPPEFLLHVENNYCGYAGRSAHFFVWLITYPHFRCYQEIINWRFKFWPNWDIIVSTKLHHFFWTKLRFIVEKKLLRVGQRFCSNVTRLITYSFFDFIGNLELLFWEIGIYYWVNFNFTSFGNFEFIILGIQNSSSLETWNYYFGNSDLSSLVTWNFFIFISFWESCIHLWNLESST